MSYHKGRTLTKDYCFTVASKYKVRQHLLDHDSSVYRKCKQEGWLEEFIPRSRRQNFTKGYCKNVASKYSSRHELELADSSVYQKCVRENWLEEFFGNKKRRVLDETLCRQVATKHKYRVDLKREDASVYQWLCENNLIEELFPAYKKTSCRDDAVYLIKTNIKVGDSHAYKIGITSSNLYDRRPQEVIQSSPIESEIVCITPVVTSARLLETEFLSMGIPIKFSTLFTGCTEYRLLSEQEVGIIMDTLNDYRREVA